MESSERASLRRLPSGSHGIPADVVARNQRERLVAAIAEECAEVGYAEATVAAVAKRAGVSSLTFYKQFKGKRECMLAAHRQLPLVSKPGELPPGVADQLGHDPRRAPVRAWRRARPAARASIAI